MKSIKKTICRVINLIEQIDRKVEYMEHLIEKMDKKIDDYNTLNSFWGASIENRLYDMSLRIYGEKEETRFAHVLKVWNELQPYTIKNGSFVRLGRQCDGGYIHLNDFRGKVAYSFGINDDVSWDYDISKLGYEVQMYDHTIVALPFENERFCFHKIGIASCVCEENAELKSLDNLIMENNHAEEKNMILKMDVEGAEWGALEMVSSETLGKFDQIVMEFHHLNDQDKNMQIVQVLQKLNQTHALVHIHPNNYCRVVYVNNCAYPDSIEVTYLNRQVYTDLENGDWEPSKMDKQNWKERDEIDIKWAIMNSKG